MVVKLGFKLLSVIALTGAVYGHAAFAVELKGTVNVHESSETATEAKTKAINSARRQILISVLSKYSDADALTELVNNTSSNDLINIISSSSVSNEQISNDSYSATITMNIDNDAVKQWLVSNNVQNWVPSNEYSEKFSLFIVVQNGISDWAEIKRLVRENNMNIETMSIQGNQIIAKMPMNHRTKFTAAIREYGWRYADNSGVLQIWK